jgi:hypothetical protein
LGMIISVSTLVISSGAATPVTNVNFSIVGSQPVFRGPK